MEKNNYIISNDNLIEEEIVEGAKENWDRYWRDVLPSEIKRGHLTNSKFARVFKAAGSGETIIRVIRKETSDCTKILETGSGSAEIAMRLAQAGKKVFAVDTSFHALHTIRNRTGDSESMPIPIQASIFELPFKNGVFDAVYNVGVLDQFPQTKQIDALNEMLEIVKPNSKIISANNDSRSLVHQIAYKHAVKTGKWRFGKKYAITSMKPLLKSLKHEINLIEFHRGFICQFEFFRYFIPQTDRVQKIFHRVLFILTLPFFWLNRFAGQFRISVFIKSRSD